MLHQLKFGGVGKNYPPMPLVTQITLCCVSFLSFLLRVAAPGASTTRAVPHPHRGSRRTGAPIAPSPTGCPRRLRLLAPRAPSPLSSADCARRPRARTTGAPTVPHRSPNRQPCPRPHPPPAPCLGRGHAPSPHTAGAPSTPHRRSASPSSSPNSDEATGSPTSCLSAMAAPGEAARARHLAPACRAMCSAR